jgi:DNA repair protein RadC
LNPIGYCFGMSALLPRRQKLRFVLREEPAVYGAKPQCDTPELIFDFYKKFIESDETFEPNKEHVWVILLNSRLQAIGFNIVSVGTISDASAHPREVLRPVLIGGAFGFVLGHHHPSGDPSPSRADEQITRRMVEAAGIMQIRLLDHVICGVPSPGRASYYSFREAGIIP